MSKNPNIIDRIFQAILLGNNEDLSSLLANNPNLDVNQLDEKGLTFLMYAVDFSNEDIVRILLQNGAEPTIKSRSTGSTALDIAQAKSKNAQSELIKPKKASDDLKSLNNYTKRSNIVLMLTSKQEELETLCDLSRNIISYRVFKESEKKMGSSDYFTKVISQTSDNILQILKDNPGMEDRLDDFHQKLVSNIRDNSPSTSLEPQEQSNLKSEGKEGVSQK